MLHVKTPVKHSGHSGADSLTFKVSVSWASSLPVMEESDAVGELTSPAVPAGTLALSWIAWTVLAASRAVLNAAVTLKKKAGS